MKRTTFTGMMVAAGFIALSQPATACSENPYLGSVCIFAGSSCPRGWTEANGQLLPISTNTKLYSVLGNIYGGDGETTFALPDLRGRVPVHVGHGKGLSTITSGQTGGSEQVLISLEQMPSHYHTAHIKRDKSETLTSDTKSMAETQHTYTAAVADKKSGDIAIVTDTAGGNEPTPVRDPFLGMRYCIAVEGVYPGQ